MSETLLAQLATQYNVNISKPNFPVNTMRLFYLLLVHDLTGGDKDALELTNKLVPKISAVLDARDMALADKSNLGNPLNQFKACTKAVDDLFAEIASPELRQTVYVLFTDVYPIQESLLSTIDNIMKQEELKIEDLWAALRIRSMDSLLYSAVLDTVVHHSQSPEGEAVSQVNPMYVYINATMQINDLVDAIIYAKQDLASKSATIVEIIKRIGYKHSSIDDTVHRTFRRLQHIIMPPVEVPAAPAAETNAEPDPAALPGPEPIPPMPVPQNEWQGFVNQLVGVVG